MSVLSRSYYRLCETRIGHRAVRAVLKGVRRVGALGDFYLPIDALDLDHEAVAALMRLWRRIHWSSGDGMMPPRQLLALYRMAATWPLDGDTVELGAWTGLTTCYLAAAARLRGDGRVFAVDTFEGTKEGGGRYESIEKYHGTTLPAFEYRIAQAGLLDFVSTVIGDSASSASRYTGGPIRLLLIDADHSYEGVRRDFDAWAPLVAPGGLVVFHDYLMSEAGVARFVNENVAVHPQFVIAPGHVTPNVMVVTRRTTAAVTTPRSAPVSTTAWMAQAIAARHEPSAPSLARQEDHYVTHEG